MNGADVLDVLSTLAKDRSDDSDRATMWQNKLVFRVVKQLHSRNPTIGEGDNFVDRFVAFARWLERSGTLENTYLGEGEGGQPRYRSLQMAADTATELVSQHLRRVVYRRKDGVAYLEEPVDWIVPTFESKINRWAHLPANALPLRIVVAPVPLIVEPAYAGLVESHGNTTLQFSVFER